MPDPRVFLLIGSEKKLSEIDENVPIYATVASRRAVQDVEKVSRAKVCICTLSEKLGMYI